MSRSPTLDDLRTYAVARSLFKPTTLPKAIARLGFVQADPIRAPARAQDLTLRHRVVDYRAGDLERRYRALRIEEDFFVNYGFLPRATQALMHPRSARTAWPAARRAQADAVLAYVSAHRSVHPRDVDLALKLGKTTNWFGGNSNASTQLLDAMHYRGMLRITGRDGGVRTYAVRDPHPPHPEPAVAMDLLVDVILRKYAPLPEPSFTALISHLQLGVPQWHDLRKGAVARAKARFPSAVVEGVRWYWPDGENPRSRRHRLDDEVRLLAPFDPIVWDRRRFERLWGWAYRFEAYTPAPKRIRGYYALPLLWRGQVIGWANAAVTGKKLVVVPGYQSGTAPRDAAFKAALAAEKQRMATFLGLP